MILDAWMKLMDGFFMPVTDAYTGYKLYSHYLLDVPDHC
jgi:hypothetical protein